MENLRAIEEEIFVPFFEEIAPGYRFEAGHFEFHKGVLYVHMVWVFDQKISERRILKMFPKRLRIGHTWYIVLDKLIGFEQDLEDGSWFLRATLKVESENDRLLRAVSIVDVLDRSPAKVIRFIGRA